MQSLSSGSAALLSSTVLSLAFTASVQAADKAEARKVETIIVTGTRQAEQLRDFAGSISLVGGNDITVVGSTHHSEIMNRAPGAMIQRNSGQESLTAIRSPVLSGPGSCGVFLFLENSVPIRPIGFCNVNELFEINSEQASSIEVLRGPAGIVYGSGAMHGAVNVISAQPGELRARSLALEGGPDEYYRGKLGLGHKSDAIDVGGVVVATHDGGWRDSSGIDEQKLNIGLTRRAGDAVMGLDLAATNLEQETAGFIQGFNAYRDENIARSNPNPEAYRDAYAVRLIGRYEQPLNERVQLAVRPYARHSRMDFIQHFLIGKPFEENGQESAGVLTSFDITAFENTRILTGVDFEFAQGFLKETQPGPATDGAPAANAIRPAGKHYDYQVDSRVAAAYGQLEQPFAERWRAIGGVRFEYVDYDYDNRMISGNTADNGSPCVPAGCLFNRPADRSDDFTNVTSKLGLSYGITEDHTLYATATRGYRAPDTSELYRLQRQQSAADLDSERLDSVEIGSRGAFGPLRYSLAAFTMEKDNVIFRDSNGFNVSDGRTDHEGIEYEFSWLPIDTVSLALAGTYAKHTYEFDRVVEQGETIVAGRDIDTAPRHINTARVNWSFLPSADAELEWVSVGSYFVDAANANEYGGHDLLNLRVSWRATENWRAILRLNNVTDRAYADRADFAFGNYRYFPGRGRTLFVEVRYEAG
jgi:outer membrane receptor protein involved in Fe transport